MAEKRILKKGEWIAWDNSIHQKEDGCRYGMADGPDDVCKECDCGDEYIKTNEIVWK
jgi:hypothetical protein